MSRLILKNVSLMDVYVPTPNGAGRRIPPGKCVEGSFYTGMKKMRHMGVVKPEDIDLNDIICKYEMITSNIFETNEARIAAVGRGGPRLVEASVPVSVSGPVSVQVPLRATTIDTVVYPSETPVTKITRVETSTTSPVPVSFPARGVVVEESVPVVEPVIPILDPNLPSPPKFVPLKTESFAHKELNKFNLNELKLTAATMGLVLDESASRRQLINAILAKGYKG